MFEWLKGRVLRLMRVPHEPEAPLGAPGSARVFRAGLNHYRLRVLRWVFAQSGAIIGIGFSLVFLNAFETAVAESNRKAALPSSAIEAQPSPAAAPSPSDRESRAERRRRGEGQIRRVVGWSLPLIWVFEVLGIGFFVVQVLVTYCLVRLEFEQHWYIVTDRSLRIRTGILRLQESTMSFANLQQVEIRQGPLQRLLGLADVCVRSAGGGDPAAGAHGQAQEGSLHMGVFEGVPNAVEIRDLILARLRRFREAGLGDPEDAGTASHLAASTTSDRSATEAVEELLSEARALRRVLTPGSPPGLVTSDL